MFSTKKRVPTASTSTATTTTTTKSKVKTVQRVVTIKAPPPAPFARPKQLPAVLPPPAKKRAKSDKLRVNPNKRRRVESETPASAPLTQDEQESDSEARESAASASPPVIEARDVVCERDVLCPLDGRVADDCMTSLATVQTAKAAYVHWFVDPTDPDAAPKEWCGHEHPQVDLELPNDGAVEPFSLMVPVQSDEYNPIVDMLKTIRTVLENYLTREQALSLFGYSSDAFAFLSAPAALSRSATPTSTREGTPIQAGTPSQPALMRQLEKARSKKDGPAFVAAVKRYNDGMRQLKESGAIKDNVRAMKGLPNKLWMHVVAQVYERIVGPDIEQLKAYEAFSDNVYGELEAKFVGDICAQTRLAPGSVFVDLGSGVGNCVLEAAIATGAESWGFENMPAASALARKQVKEAESRFRLWGLSSGPMRVEECDFCESPLVPQVLKRADTVLVNNEVFTASLNEKLSLMFLEMKGGARIVSLKAFASGFTLSAYTRHSPLAILDQGDERHYGRHAVSWKNEGGTYFIATVDRSKIEEFDRKQAERMLAQQQLQQQQAQVQPSQSQSLQENSTAQEGAQGATGISS